MFLGIEWPRIQGTRVSKCENTIFWEQGLAERESHELNELDIDDNEGILMENNHRKLEDL